jgi:hypothetical protein
MKYTRLPENYKEIKRVDLKKDKKVFLLINLGALLIMAVMILIANKFIPLPELFIKIVKNNNGEIFILWLLFPAVILYTIAHEATHGFFMKRFSGIKPKYGITSVYAYAGSEAFFNKTQYLIITLSPVVILGLLLLLLNLVVPIEWFWFIYFIQVSNISGAAGDLYVTYLIKKVPVDTLTQDSGVSMVMYSKTE